MVPGISILTPTKVIRNPYQLGIGGEVLRKEKISKQNYGCGKVQTKTPSHGREGRIFF